MYLTPAQVAKRLSVSVETVRAMCRSGKLHHVRIGVGSIRPPIRIPESALRDLLQINGVNLRTSEETYGVSQGVEDERYLESWKTA